MDVTLLRAPKVHGRILRGLTLIVACISLCAPNIYAQSSSSTAPVFAEFAWLLLLGVSGYGVKCLHDMSQSVTEFSRQVVKTLDRHERKLEQHDEILLGRVS